MNRFVIHLKIVDLRATYQVFRYAEKLVGIKGDFIKHHISYANVMNMSEGGEITIV